MYNLREINDDFHFVIKCPAYSAIRSKYIPHHFYRRPSALIYTRIYLDLHSYLP